MREPALWSAIEAAVNGHEVRTLQADGRAPVAVLILLVPHASGPHVVFTVRSQEVEHHKGEISFPGGMQDAGDRDLCATALRESHEEVGTPPSDVEVLGELSHYVTRTGFHITPFVGRLSHAPYAYTPSAVEVAEVLEVPLTHLLAAQHWEQRAIVREGRTIEMRSYRWHDHLIYGATAMMLRMFLSDVAAELGIEH